MQCSLHLPGIRSTKPCSARTSSSNCWKPQTSTTHTYTHAHAHVHAHAPAHKYTHAHTRAHKHTHTHLSLVFHVTPTCSAKPRNARSSSSCHTPNTPTQLAGCSAASCAHAPGDVAAELTACSPLCAGTPPTLLPSLASAILLPLPVCSKGE